MRTQDDPQDQSTLDQIVRRFEDAWQTGTPRLEDYLDAGPVPRGVLLFRLVSVDLRRRLQSGLPARVEDYLRRFPELERRLDDLVELVTAEFSQCLLLGQTPSPDEYLGRSPDLRTRLAERLRGTDDAGSTVGASAARPQSLPERVGRYRVLGEIARGGMGLVVRVHDEDFDRPLAMKVLLRHAGRRPDLHERFLREARVTGRLQHPGVPPVQELGRLPDGRPFFIMKLIQGQSLNAVLRHRRALDQDLPRLLHIFEQICQTLAYAHRRGIIHRDLKPSNIMVGAFGEVQVMDWGLAKELCGTEEPSSTNGGERESRSGGVEESRRQNGDLKDDAVGGRDAGEDLSPHAAADSTQASIDSPEHTPDSRTRAGQILGTPGYMAPEQARGDVADLDERCDVFGLGAILCDILTGQPPFATGTPADRTIQTGLGEVGEAFDRLRRCGADEALVRLACRCLAAEKEQRFADADAVAAAVAEYRAGLQERLKQAEIRRAAAQARADEEGRTRQEAERRAAAEQARAAAERQRRRVQLALAAALVLFTLAGGAAAVWYANDQAAREHERLAQLAEQERAQAQAAEQKSRATEEVAAALAQAERALADLRAELQDPLHSSALLSDIDQWQARLGKARAHWQRAGSLAAANRDVLDAGLLARLERDQAQLAADENNYALARRLDNIHLTGLSLANGRFDPARAAPGYARFFKEQKLDVRHGDPISVAKRVKESPICFALVAALDDWAAATQLARAHDDELFARLLAVARLADPDPWREEFRDVAVWRDRKLLEELCQTVDTARQPPRIVQALAQQLQRTGGDGVPILRSALVHHPRDFWFSFMLGILARHPGEQAGYCQAALTVRPASSVAHNNLGLALFEQKDFRGAAECYRKAIALDEQFADAYTNLGAVLKETGQPEEAVAHHRKAIKLDPECAQAHYNLALTMEDRQEWDQAASGYRKTIALDPTYAPAHNNLGLLLIKKDQVDEAIKCYRRAIKADAKLAAAHANLGNALQQKKDWDGAIDSYKKAIALDAKFAVAHNNLGNALQNKGELQAAIPCYKKAIEIDATLAQPHYNLGNVYKREGEMDRAVACYKKAIELNPDYLEAHTNLGTVLHARKDFEGAAECYRAAIKLDGQKPNPHVGLGLALLEVGQFGEARQALAQALSLLTGDEPLAQAAKKEMQKCDQFLAIDNKIAAILKGDVAPGAAPVQLAQARFCQKYHKNYAAVRMYESAFAKDPDLAKQPGKYHRYNAACAAVLAAAGKGRELPKLEAKDLQKLRQQALAWLRAELKGLEERLKADGQPTEQLHKDLQFWRDDPNLASVRAAKELERLDEAERRQWQQLWSDVEALAKTTDRIGR